MANNDFDVDQLKDSWQKQNVSAKYDHSAIEKMLNHKSRNYVKYILWINILEFLMVLVANVYYLYTDHNTDSLIQLLGKLGIQNSDNLQMNYQHLYFGLEVFSLIFTGIFLVLFYLKYKKIRVVSDLKSLIIQIIQFKRIVNLFILLNVALIVIFIGTLTLFTAQIINDQNIEISAYTLRGLYVGIVIILPLGAAMVWLYYRLVYGIIMKRLTYNLKQLKEIEDSTKDIE